MTKVLVLPAASTARDVKNVFSKVGHAIDFRLKSLLPVNPILR